MKDTLIRKMREADLDDVTEIDAIAFETWLKNISRQEASLPRRTRRNVYVLLSKDPQGCFVAEVDGQIVGLIFSRTWGQVGWFGTFAVLPDFQGRGIGRQLVKASLEYLCQVHGRVIGLETMPDSPYNLGLYLRLGFQVCYPTMILTKELEKASKNDVRLPRWSQADSLQQEQWLAELRESTGRLLPGFDYSKEIVTTARDGLGDTLVLSFRSKAVGMSTLWLESSRENMGSDTAFVQVLAIHPGYTSEHSLCELLDASEALGRLYHKKSLAISVNSSHAWALERMLHWGYRVERLSVRMILRGTEHESDAGGWVNCSRWAG